MVGLRISSNILKAVDKQTKQIKRLKNRSNSNLSTVSRELRSRLNATLNHLEKKGWIPVVYWSGRTKEQQAEIVKAGSSPTMNSFHVVGSHEDRMKDGIFSKRKGEAADIVDARFLWSGPCANLNHPFWNDLGSYSKAQGLEWGGDWNKPDVAHVQFIITETTQDTRHPRA